MDREIIGLLGFAGALLLIFLRVPIGVAMGLAAVMGISVLISPMAAIGISKAVPYELIGDWNLSAVPMFLLMGFLASGGGLTAGLFGAARVFMGRIPGGLASSTVVACALFSAASGSSVATAAAFARIAVPEMLRAGYQPALAAGSVAAAGTLGNLIPPGILFIIFGLMMDVSIGALFIAGIIPGLITAFVFITLITVRVKLNPALAPRDRTVFTEAERRQALADIWPLPVLIISVLGGIFTGVFTATEAGAIGAALAAIIALARRTLTMPLLLRSIRDTAEATAAIFIIVVGAALFARFMALSALPAAFSAWLGSITQDPMTIVAIVALLYLVLGMFLESISIMLLTLPILAPLLASAGVDLIWFGVVAVKLLEVGLITPPVGMNVYVIKSALGDRVPLTTVFAGALWFVAFDMITIVLLVLFPALSTWLPALMGAG